MALIAPGMVVAGGRYWLVLCLASLLGADLGDMVAHDLHWGHWFGVPPLLALLLAAVVMGRRTTVAAGAWFWAAVVLVRAIATNLADLATHDLHLAQPSLVGLLAVALLAAGAGASATRTDLRFWIALFLAGTLGTILGDDASHRLGLDAATTGLGLLLAMAFLVTARADRTRPRFYWPLVLLARIAGTSGADLLADRSGLGLDGSTILIAVLFALAIRTGRRSSTLAAARSDQRRYAAGPILSSVRVAKSLRS